MNKSGVDRYSLNNVHTSDLRPNIYDRISKMAEDIGDIKSELAREKELLSIEKIKRSNFIQRNSRTQSTFPSYHSAQQLQYQDHIQLNHENFAHYEAQQYYHNMYQNNQMYQQNNGLGSRHSIEVERQMENSLEKSLHLTQSEKEILEREKRKIQNNFKRQLANIEKQCNIEKIQVKKNMNTLYKVTEQILPRYDTQKKREQRKHGENYIRR